MALFSNIRGTSEAHFRISLSGPTIYHGTADPTVAPPASLDGLALNPGDLYIRTGGTSQSLHVLGSGGDTDWNEFLETGASSPTTIGGDLTVQGEFDTWDDLIVLNSDGGALTGGIGGIEITRPAAAPTVQWVWNDTFSYWEASSNPDTPSLHNVMVENNLTVGASGKLTVPNGLAATPGIRFSSAGVGVYSSGADLGFSTGGAGRWSIDASGNLLPASTHNIGATGAPTGSVYTTLVANTDGAVGTPSYTFDSDLTTGIFVPAAGTIGFTSGGSEVARIGATEMELQGTLKITDGTSWTIDNDGADSNKLKLAYSTTDTVVMTTSGELLIGDGSQANPAYSFLSDDTIGMYWDGTDIRFTVALGSDHLVISPTAINAPAATVTNPQDLTTKAYVDAATGGSWRQPVIVKDDTVYANLAGAEATMNTGTVDGVSVTAADRILYTGIAGQPQNVFIINGTPGSSATLVEDINALTHGDTVYVNEGTNTNNVYSYGVTNTWSEISATSGFGGTLYFNYETQTTAGSAVFTLSSIKYAPTTDGARLLVYINGVKQVFSAAYTETNETTITFGAAPGAGQTIEFYAVGLATTDGIIKREDQTGLTGAPLITLNTITYVPSQDGLLVFLNGQKVLNDGVAYTELTSTTIQWNTPALVATDVLEFYSSVPIVAGVNLEDISNVSAVVVPLDNDQLTYNTTTGQWEAKTPGTSQTGLLRDKESDLTPAPNGVITTFTTLNVSVLSDAAPRSYIQVFVNGALQREGVAPTDDYVVGAPNTITFAVPPAAADKIDIYQL